MKKFILFASSILVVLGSVSANAGRISSGGILEALVADGVGTTKNLTGVMSQTGEACEVMLKKESESGYDIAVKAGDKCFWHHAEYYGDKENNSSIVSGSMWELTANSFTLERYNNFARGTAHPARTSQYIRLNVVGNQLEASCNTHVYVSNSSVDRCIVQMSK